MKSRFNIDVRIDSEVVGIDTEKKIVTVRSKDQGIFEESYDVVVTWSPSSPNPTVITPSLTFSGG